MTVETIGTCEKHELPLDPNGECQLCRLSEMPSRAPSSRGSRWVVMALVALVAGAVSWAVASFEPAQAPSPTRGVLNSGARTAAPASQGRAPEEQAILTPPPPAAQDQTLEAPPTPDTASATPSQADDQAQQWAHARERVRILMYATPSCGVCSQAREYMQNDGIAFTEHNIEEDEAADTRIRELNPERTTPTFEIDDLVLVGFSPDTFEATRTQAARNHLSVGDKLDPL